MKLGPISEKKASSEAHQELEGGSLKNTERSHWPLPLPPRAALSLCGQAGRRCKQGEASPLTLLSALPSPTGISDWQNVMEPAGQRGTHTTK